MSMASPVTRFTWSFFQGIFLFFQRTSVWVKIHTFTKIYNMLQFFPSRNRMRGGCHTEVW